jgi:ATP-binding cassette subfamily C (CFTR/MRP) protein 1
VSGDVRSNITFGLPFDQDFYEQVIQACCLREDFRQLPNGDLTKVGEMGHILSGGQRSRVSIARALYRKSTQIVLIDGSLSSLDARVARQLLDSLVHGEITKGKIVVLVTYDLDQATEMDYILHVTDEGTVDVMTQADFKGTQGIMTQETHDDSNGPSGGNDVLKEEVNERGKVVWSDYKAFFKYSFGGLWGIAIIIVLHMIIHGSTLAVSIYLGLTLTNHFSE